MLSDFENKMLLLEPRTGSGGELKAIEKLLHKLRKEFREMFPLRSEFEPVRERQ